MNTGGEIGTFSVIIVQDYINDETGIFVLLNPVSNSRFVIGKPTFARDRTRIEFV
jgi:hypothetical protein